MRETGYQPRVTPLKRFLGLVLIVCIFFAGIFVVYGRASGRSAYVAAGTGLIFAVGAAAWIITWAQKRRDPQFRAFTEALKRNRAPARKRQRSAAFMRAGMAFLVFVGVLIVSIARHSSAAFAHLGKAPFLAVALLPLGAGLFVVLRNKRARESEP